LHKIGKFNVFLIFSAYNTDTMSYLPKVLLVEDDRSISDALVYTLKTSYDIDVAGSGESGLYKSAIENYAIVMLDLNLPDLPGIIVCQRLRERGVTAPILILSGEARVLTKINLLDAGANDYMTKPFSLGELKARLRALTRVHQQPIWPEGRVEACGIVLDRRTFTVKRDDQPVRLRPKEFNILECLMKSAGCVVSRQELVETVWEGRDKFWANSLEVHMKYLRDKIDKPFDSPLISTVHGRGYRLGVAINRKRNLAYA
jgi:two-component system OmpR family response regulator